MQTIEDEISGMSTDFADKLQFLKTQMAESARLEKQKLEKAELDRKEKERQALEAKAERDRIAEKERLENERRLAEAKRQSEEATRQELARQEQARIAREKEEKEEAARQAKEEEERRAREAEDERLRREAENEFKKTQLTKVKDIKAMAETVVNIKNADRNNILQILIKIYNALKQKNTKQELDTYLASSDYTQNIEMINRFIALRPITYGIFKSKKENQDKIVNLSHIFKFKDTFDTKEEEQKKEIINVINTQVGGTGGTGGSIVGDNFRELVSNTLLNDLQLKDLNDPNKNETKIENEADLTTKLTQIDGLITRVLASADIIQDFYEILLGAARVFVNMKPLNKNNNAPERKFDTIFNIDGTQGAAAEAAGGGVLQKGGYNYSDVISIEGDKHNYVKIGDLCSINLQLTEENNTFGPFAAIYPPQYNNSHIYGSMFGSKRLKELYEDTTLDTSMNFSPESFLLKNADTTNKTIPKGSEILNSNESLQYQHLMKKLAREGNVIIFGYGFSGSGKTYLLIEGSPNPATYDPSILEQFISNNTENIASVEFLEIYPYGKGEYGEIPIDRKTYVDYVEKNRDIKIFCSEAYKTNSENIQKFGANSMESEKIDPNIIKQYCNEISGDITADKYLDIFDLFATISDKTKINFNYISNRIKLLERHRIHNLRILPTPNNDKSSRSFLQITINLQKNGSKSGKLVLFDMPGTENTIRIRTEFITPAIFNSRIDFNKIGSFSDIDFQRKGNIVGSFADLNEALKHCDIKTHKDTKYNDNRVTSVKWKNLGYTPEAKKELYNNKLTKISAVFKYFFIQRVQFASLGIIVGNKEDFPISDIGHDFAMFINGKDKNFYDCNDDEIIYFLNNDAFSSIVDNFIINYLNKKDKDDKNMFWDDEVSIDNPDDKPNDNCKIRFKINSNNDINDNIITEQEYDKIFDIFGIRIDRTTNYTNLYFALQNADSNPNSNLDKKLIFNKKAEKIVGTQKKTIHKSCLINLKTYSKTYRYDTINEMSDKFIDINSNFICFSNPIIKYIYIILNYLFTINLRVNHTVRDDHKRNLLNLINCAATFFIYKYIKYIVNQGKGIVTNLEHLKFFFLSRTYAINDYNKNCLKNNNNKDKDKAFVFNEGQKDALIKQPKYYKFSVKITDTVLLDETVNIGNMYQYKLLTVLQDLAGSVDTNMLQEKQSVDNNYTLNLLQTKTGKQQISIFIMMTNLKIFRDDTTDDVAIGNVASSAEDIRNKISQVCIAEYDTLDFAQSISSTSIAKNALKQLEAKKTEIPKDSDDTELITRLKNNVAFKDLFREDTIAVGGKRKFNMNQLLEHKNKKPRTHRNLSSKNKKSKVFYNRTKKNN